MARSWLAMCRQRAQPQQSWRAGKEWRLPLPHLLLLPPRLPPRRTRSLRTSLISTLSTHLLQAATATAAAVEVSTRLHRRLAWATSACPAALRLQLHRRLQQPCQRHWAVSGLPLLAQLLLVAQQKMICSACLLAAAVAAVLLLPLPLQLHQQRRLTRLRCIQYWLPLAASPSLHLSQRLQCLQLLLQQAWHWRRLRRLPTRTRQRQPQLPTHLTHWTSLHSLSLGRNPCPSPGRGQLRHPVPCLRHMETRFLPWAVVAAAVALAVAALLQRPVPLVALALAPPQLRPPTRSQLLGPRQQRRRRLIMRSVGPARLSADTLRQQ